MSTAAQVRTAWNTNVFQQASVQALTTSIYDHELNERSIKERAKARYAQKVNCITYLVKRTPKQTQISGGSLIEYEYEVEVDYYLERDPDSSNYTAAVDAFETINGEVISTLGNTWAGTVDFSILPERAPQILDESIGSVEVWRVNQTYLGFKTV